MPEYRRYFVPGGTYFFTVVVYQRHPLFRSPLARTLLRESIQEVRARWNFQIIAWVLLWEHLHAIWTLPPGDERYSLRWSRIKECFTRRWRRHGGHEFKRNASRIKRRERAIWQRRFWEHTIRNEDDLSNHFDYVHWNPVKHGLVNRVVDWPYSTFHHYVREGYYSADWGTDPVTRKHPNSN